MFHGIRLENHANVNYNYAQAAGTMLQPLIQLTETKVINNAKENNEEKTCSSLNEFSTFVMQLPKSIN